MKVKRSIFLLCDTAVISLPLSAYLFNQTSQQMQKVAFAEQFKPGDKVVIKAGYNGKLYTEFVGFVRRLNLKSPLEIECEDWTYPLRSINIKRSWRAVKLKDLLGYLADQCGFTLSSHIVDITIVNFVANNCTALFILQELKDKYGLTIYFNQDNTLFAGLAYTEGVNTSVKLVIGKNVKKADDLKYQNADDVKLRVKAISLDENGSKIEAEIGTKDGELRTLHFYDINSKAELEKLAKTELERYKYSGYRGKINCLLAPYFQPGEAAELVDPDFTVRGGRYFIEDTTMTYGMNGATRTGTLGIKLNV